MIPFTSKHCARSISQGQSWIFRARNCHFELFEQNLKNSLFRTNSVSSTNFEQPRKFFISNTSNKTFVRTFTKCSNIKKFLACSNAIQNGRFFDFFKNPVHKQILRIISNTIMFEILCSKCVRTEKSARTGLLEIQPQSYFGTKVSGAHIPRIINYL